MKLIITLKLHDDGDGATLVPTIDGIAHEVFAEPVKALPKPQPWWKFSALDVAVFSGAVAGFVWLLS